MTITTEHIQKLAKLTRIALTPETLPIMTARLSKLIDLMQTMQTVDTDGIPPLFHPASFMQHDASLILRDDQLESNIEHNLSDISNMDLISRDQRMLNAPVKQAGYFLVPRVLE